MGSNMYTQSIYTKYIWAVFGSCNQWARKPQNYPITASYIDGLTPKIKMGDLKIFNWQKQSTDPNKVRRQNTP
jgi:hypothetical protein